MSNQLYVLVAVATVKTMRTIQRKGTGRSIQIMGHGTFEECWARVLKFAHQADSLGVKEGNLPAHKNEEWEYWILPTHHVGRNPATAGSAGRCRY